MALCNQSGEPERAAHAPVGLRKAPAPTGHASQRRFVGPVRLGGVMQVGRSRSLPVVVADQAAKDLAADDLPVEMTCDGAVRWAQLQRPMRPSGVVVTHELGEGPSKVALVQDDVVQALVACRANPAFRATIDIR